MFQALRLSEKVYEREGESLLGGSRWGWPGGVTAIALLAVAVRVAALLATAPVGVTGDESYYFQIATQIASGQGHTSPADGSRASWPPGYPAFLALFIDMERPNLDAEALLFELLVMQCLLGGLLVALTAYLGRALFNTRTGLLAGILCALYPTLIAFSHYLFSETFFALLLVTALWGVVAWRARRSGWLAAGVGIVFGMAALTREIALPVAGACALWWIWSSAPALRRSSVAQAAIMLACAVLVITPWVARNYAILGRVVVVSSAGWLNARSGNTLAGESWLHPDGHALEAFRSSYFAIEDEMERADYARSQAFALIRAEQPSWIFKKAARTLGGFFSPDSYLLKKISRGAYGRPDIIWVRSVLLVSALAFCAVFVCAVPAALCAGSGRSSSSASRSSSTSRSASREGRSLVGFVLCAVLGVHLLANVSPRYRLPFMPLMIVFAAAALSRGPAVWGDLERWARVVAGVVLLIFVAFCLPYFYADAASLWMLGHYVEPFRP